MSLVVLCLRDLSFVPAGRDWPPDDSWSDRLLACRHILVFPGTHLLPLLLRVHTAAKITGLPTGIQQKFETFETLRPTQPRAAQTHNKKGVQPAHCGIPDAVDAAPIGYHGPLEYFKTAIQRPDLPRSAGTM